MVVVYERVIVEIVLKVSPIILCFMFGRGGRVSVLLLLCLLVLWLLLWWWLQKAQQTSCISSRVTAICHQLLLLIHQGVGGRRAWQDMARHTCFTVPSLVCKIIIIQCVTDVWSGMT